MLQRIIRRSAEGGGNEVAERCHLLHHQLRQVIRGTRALLTPSYVATLETAVSPIPMMRETAASPILQREAAATPVPPQEEVASAPPPREEEGVEQESPLSQVAEAAVPPASPTSQATSEAGPAPSVPRPVMAVTPDQRALVAAGVPSTSTPKTRQKRSASREQYKRWLAGNTGPAPKDPNMILICSQYGLARNQCTAPLCTHCYRCGRTGCSVRTCPTCSPSWVWHHNSGRRPRGRPTTHLYRRA